MPADDYEKETAKEEAAGKSDEEQNRWEYYNTLCYSYRPCSVKEWISYFYNKHYKKYEPVKDISFFDARISAHISWKEYAKSRFNKHYKQEVDEKIEKVKKEDQEIIDQINQNRKRRVKEDNERLNKDISNYKKLLYGGDQDIAEQYFSYVLESDKYSIDGVEYYPINCDLSYNHENGRLVIDYALPKSEEISKIKNWIVKNKTNEIQPQYLKDSDFYSLYERLLMNIIIRVIALIIDSDEANIIKEIVYNGYWENSIPMFVISFLMKRKQFKTSDINRADFVSKEEIKSFEKVRYIGNIASEKETKDLMSRYPENEVIPFESNIHF